MSHQLANIKKRHNTATWFRRLETVKTARQPVLISCPNRKSTVSFKLGLAATQLIGCGSQPAKHRWMQRLRHVDYEWPSDKNSNYPNSSNAVFVHGFNVMITLWSQRRCFSSSWKMVVENPEKKPLGIELVAIVPDCLLLSLKRFQGPRRSALARCTRAVRIDREDPWNSFDELRISQPAPVIGVG